MEKIESKSKGFTLVELLVVIAIIAILAVIGVTVYGGIQQNARNARRQSDVSSIANSLEVNKSQGLSTYDRRVRITSFSAGAIPADSQNGGTNYIIVYRTDTTAAAKPTTWAQGATLPTVTGNTVEAISTTDNTTPVNPPTSFYICTLLEGGSNPTNISCKGSQQ